MSDTISDLLTQIRNISATDKDVLVLPFSKSKKAILDVMKKEGFISEIEEIHQDVKKQKMLKIKLGQKNINCIKRLSKPGNRKYTGSKKIPRSLRGFGLIIISTPKGIISGNVARKMNLGGELICEIW